MAGVSIAHFATKRGCWQPVLVNQVGPGEWLPSISHVSRRFQPWASEADLGAFYRGLCRIIEAVFLCYLETRRGLAVGGAKPVTIGERHHQTVPPRPLFHPKSRPHISTKDFYPPPSGPTAKMIMRNVMGWVTNGHAQYSATRNGMKRRAADGKLRQTDGQA